MPKLARFTCDCKPIEQETLRRLDKSGASSFDASHGGAQHEHQQNCRRFTVTDVRIEVPDDRVNDVLSRLESLLKLPVPSEPPISAEKVEPAANPENGSGPENNVDGNRKPEEAAPLLKKRSRTPSKTAKAYELVNLQLSEEQRKSLRDYYQEKDPDSQNDMVAVLGVKLKELTRKSEFGPNDIHSAFKLVNKPTPRNLIAVFGNMKRDGRAGYGDSKLQVNSHTEDYVNYHMHQNKKKKDK